MEYKKMVRHQMTNLTDHEASAVQAGLVLLANGARYGDGSSYPEYRKTAADLLKTLDQPEAGDPPA